MGVGGAAFSLLNMFDYYCILDPLKISNELFDPLDGMNLERHRIFHK